MAVSIMSALETAQHRLLTPAALTDNAWTSSNYVSVVLRSWVVLRWTWTSRTSIALYNLQHDPSLWQSVAKDRDSELTHSTTLVQRVVIFVP
jgi:hypothetical protein